MYITFNVIQNVKKKTASTRSSFLLKKNLTEGVVLEKSLRFLEHFVSKILVNRYTSGYISFVIFH